MKNIFKCAMIIIGTIIGAGFASGQEIATFFNRFSDMGMCGLILSSLLFGIIIFTTMFLLNKRNVDKFEILVNNNKFAITIMKAFTFICFCIMISAVGSYGNQQYGISFGIGAILTGIICFIAFLFRFTGLEMINNILVPFILFGTLLLCFATYDADYASNLENFVLPTSIFMNNWFLSAILYAGYNSILLIPILVELKTYKLNIKDITLLSALVALALAVAGLMIYGAINAYYPGILSVELPTLALAEYSGGFIKYYYGIVILFAILTTAFSCGYAFLKMNSEKNYLRNAFLICVLGVILSRVGFADMINFFFPLFGYFGIGQILVIALSNKKESK